ncbi:hypothetical protein BV20DRAFT_1051989 [Pilatotrama ljubarskyi]|nr:hypothetical protein BV20DRAFT_1051989 [Pilatotrama ljubarskyi]
MTIPRSVALSDALTTSVHDDDVDPGSIASLSDLGTLTPSPLPAFPPPAPVSSSVPAPDPEPITWTVIPPSMLMQWPVADLLDLNTGNYRKWKRGITNVLSVCGCLDLYLTPGYPCPPRATRLDDARNWVINDRHVQAFIRIQCSEYELEHLPPTTSAAALWSFLHTRHLNRGAHAQVFLLRDLLQLRFDVAQPLAPQAQDAIRHCRQIIAMGALDADC